MMKVYIVQDHHACLVSYQNNSNKFLSERSENMQANSVFNHQFSSKFRSSNINKLLPTEVDKVLMELGRRSFG